MSPRRKPVSPRTAALRFRIWAYCNPRGWNCTIRELADALDEGTRSIAQTLHHAGWSARVRSPARNNESSGWGFGGDSHATL